MDTAFITGATGFVGANLARTLLDKGMKVRALARPNSNRKNLQGLPVDIIEGDLLSPQALAEGCQGCRYVFHVAADYRIWVPNPQDMYKANIQGTINVIAAAGKAGVERIVHCSSVAAVKPRLDRVPANEHSHYANPDQAIGAYKKSKILAEAAALDMAAKKFPIVVVNPAAPVGPYDIKPTPTGKIIVDFISGRMPSYIDTGLNIVSAQDVAMGHYLAATRGRIGERYILGGDNLTLREVLHMLAQATGVREPLFKTPYVLALMFGALDTARARFFGGEPLAPIDAVRMAKNYMWFDSSKAKDELGYHPRAAKTALAEAAQWFIANGYVKGKAKATQAAAAV